MGENEKRVITMYYICRIHLFSCPYLWSCLWLVFPASLNKFSSSIKNAMSSTCLAWWWNRHCWLAASVFCIWICSSNELWQYGSDVMAANTLGLFHIYGFSTYQPLFADVDLFIFTNHFFPQNWTDFFVEVSFVMRHFTQIAGSTGKNRWYMTPWISNPWEHFSSMCFQSN